MKESKNQNEGLSVKPAAESVQTENAAGIFPSAAGARPPPPFKIQLGPIQSKEEDNANSLDKFHDKPWSLQPLLNEIRVFEHGVPQVIQKFDSPEHVQVGNAGGPGGLTILLDSHQRDLPNRTAAHSQWSPNMQLLYDNGDSHQRRFLRYGLTYGEMVALSGDFYETFEDLNRAPLLEVYDLVPLVNAHATTEQLQNATGGRYLSLAQRNDAHFSVVGPGRANNMETWRQRHIQAIVAARQGNANLAYGVNAAADHFLTDRFAAGHLLTNRSDLSTLGGVQALTHHDIDNQNGVNVSNLRGDVWIAYGDEKWDIALNAENRTYTRQAVEASVRDIANALSQGTTYPLPDAQTRFEAESIVPQLSSATQRGSHSTRPFIRGLSSRVSGLPGVLTEEVATSDNIVRDWVGRMDDAGIRAQPPREQVRMVSTLLEGAPSNQDAEAVLKICRNTTSRFAAERIRRLLQPHLIGPGEKRSLRQSLEALPFSPPQQTPARSPSNLPPERLSNQESLDRIFRFPDPSNH